MIERLNTKQIETMSVTKLKDALIRTGIADPDILENDTTPSWDGEIRLYTTPGDFSKENLRAKIPVQVKGTCVEKFPKGKASFSVDVSDLTNYQKSHGVMFFLVQMQGFDEYKIYYSALLPFDLREKLAQAPGQKTKTIKLDVFPHKYVNGMIKILVEFLADWEKQGKLLPNVWSMHDLEGQAIEIESLEVSVSSVGVEDEDELAKELLRKPRFVYAKFKGLDAEFAVDKFWPTSVSTKKKVSVSVNGEILFDHITIVRNHRKAPVMHIGNSIQLTPENNSINFNYACQGMLQEEIKCLKLVAALMQHETITFGENRIPSNAVTVPKEEVQECSAALQRMEAAARTLNALHIKKDLAYGSLSNHDRHSLDLLIRGIDEGKPVLLKAHENSFGKLTIGNLNILLCATINPDGKGVFISDFFAQRKITKRLSNMGQEIDVHISPYVLLSADMLQEIDNVNISEIVPSIMSVPYSQPYGDWIVSFALELLKLYDLQPNAAILDVVLQLIDFLEGNDPKQYDLYQINRLQTEKRRRRLTKSEVKYLMKLKGSAVSTEFQLAASILLESYQEAQILYDSLDPEIREAFDEYPIKHLWKHT